MSTLAVPGKNRSLPRTRIARCAVIAACAGLIVGISVGCSSSPEKGINMSTSSTAYPLPAAKLCAFAATTDADRCKKFYVEKLGLRLMHEDGYGIVLDSGGTMLRIQKGPEITLVPRTVLGWNVTDIEPVVKSLIAAGITFEKFTWFKQDENGITTFPDGARVAWFKDPDGNILGVSQVPYK